MNRIERRFKDLRRTRQKAFIAFITAGYPDLETTRKLVIECAASGVDIIELGVPFSDPMADGPIIQEASLAALKRNTTLGQIIAMVKDARKKTEVSLCLMSYYNPIFCFGEERFVAAAVGAGVDGVIVPDLPPEEGCTLRASAARHGLDTIFFVSPTTSAARMEYISRVSTGFIYYVSLTGVTGPRTALPADLKHNIRLVKSLTAKPVCVGFGISSAAQVKQIYAVSDGVIVGSAIVNKIKECIGRRDLVSRVTGFIRSLQGDRK